MRTEAHAADVSAPPAPPSPTIVLLVDDAGAARLFDCSPRTFSSFMDADWMPKPIRLGPRLRRWSVDELRTAVAGMPRETSRPVQPSALRARIDSLKGVSHAD